MLNSRYNNALSQKDKLFYSKLAMLELCGWIEESMDDIIQRCADRFSRDQIFRNRVDKDIIKPNYGFEYKRNFIKMLTTLIGYINVVKLEKKLDFSKKEQLTSALSSLKKIRNREAHTHLKGMTRHVDSPSMALNYFERVYNGLKDIEKKLKDFFT